MGRLGCAGWLGIQPGGTWAEHESLHDTSALAFRRFECANHQGGHNMLNDDLHPGDIRVLCQVGVPGHTSLC